MGITASEIVFKIKNAVIYRPRDHTIFSLFVHVYSTRLNLAYVIQEFNPFTSA